MMTDKELMALAKTRVMSRNVYKWLWVAYFAVNTFLTAIWFFLTDRKYFWPGWVIAGWGFALTVLGIIFKALLSGTSSDRVADEYRKLKQSAATNDMVDDKRNNSN